MAGIVEFSGGDTQFNVSQSPLRDGGQRLQCSCFRVLFEHAHLLKSFRSTNYNDQLRRKAVSRF